MKRLEIIRIESTDNHTRGVLLINGVLECCTLELPYKDNAKDISAIPIGKYKGTRHKSPKFGDVFKIHDVPERSDILIHVGNTAEESLGCVLVGQSFGELDGMPAVLESKKALESLRQKLGNETFEMEISELM